ncbi:DUF4160 domain-containing protein [endosymbiont GvMRE of Glomus versiforme]|uniref:DUF4160 domain-containing protein n=1 Tax=endosymbiont GvMRE of Glomus versiforme TaxID=2039283 RepID=UPI000EC9E899|nr:DUF4160 domain-containing protein [endosymbiont GvMRE of Glomus versiforme]RHZ36444.1 hypothetical protein GvMRE_Ic1g235 [endosymbiont GvMRE of Glomus versiforme]
MVSIFEKKDPRRNWRGYDFILRPGEFAEDPNKEIHIHVIGEKGSMKVRLNPPERDKSQETDLSLSEQRKIEKFIQENLTDIKQKIKKELTNRNIKTNRPF